jgi:hypothetical protein
VDRVRHEQRRPAGRPARRGDRLPAEFQVDFLRVYAYDASSAPVAGAAQARPSTTAGATVRRIVAVVALAVAVTAAFGAAFYGYARLRARRRLRPAHRA